MRKECGRVEGEGGGVGGGGGGGRGRCLLARRARAADPPHVCQHQPRTSSIGPQFLAKLGVLARPRTVLKRQIKQLLHKPAAIARCICRSSSCPPILVEAKGRSDEAPESVDESTDSQPLGASPRTQPAARGWLSQ